MSGSVWSGEFMDQLRTWLTNNLNSEDLDHIIPANDPLRVWMLQPEHLEVDALLEVIQGGRDHLTLLTLIQYARTRAAADSFPRNLELELTKRLLMVANEERANSRISDFHAFFSYSHRDMGRAMILLSVFRKAGLRVFHDVDNLEPGDSIVGRLHEVMSNTSKAILLITQRYIASQWAQRELNFLLSRYKSKDVLLLPILLDDIALPRDIADIFTVDLRGFQNFDDLKWAEGRLKRLIDQCRA